MRLISKASAWFIRFFTKGEPPYKVVYVEEPPTELNKNYLYLIGENEHLWHIVLLCPCGCNSHIYLNLQPENHPVWTYRIQKQRISIKPSVWRTSGCRSHFWITSGTVKWVLL
ncbi:hypothetical protein NT6N_15020 [Oceaniferula spumae]|uniref:Uncharacterized protein n=1 Tax=Oceaniferula spumae TaxID=2979115 RepID=A0AAT9FKI7_9BACT